MTYDEYTLKVRARVKRFRKIELWIKKHKIIVITAAAVVFAVLFAMLYFSGSFTSKMSAENAVYGEKAVVEPKAFLSAVKLTYTENGETKSGLPFRSGTYELKAETTNPLGVKREQSAEFVISKRQAEIGLSEFSIEYGDQPDAEEYVTATGLADGDRVASAVVEYDGKTRITSATVKSVVIENAKGEDVTSCYDLTFGSTAVTVLQRRITIVTGSAEKKYDGTELTCHEYEFEYGSLAYDDVLEMEFLSSVTDAGVMTNRASGTITDKDGNIVTDRYAVTYKFGTLEVLRRNINIKTGSAEKEYDGEPLSCHDYEITSSELMEGHTIEPVEYPSMTYTGKVKNYIIFEVKDKDGNVIAKTDASGIDTTNCYNIKVEAGVIEIKARDIVIKTPSYEFEYDSKSHQPVDSIEIVSGQLYDGDSIKLKASSAYLSAGTYKSMCTLEFGGVVPATAYNVIFDYGTVLVTKRPVTMYYTVRADARRSAFVASLSDTDPSIASMDSINTSSVDILIPVDTDYGDFEDTIRDNIKIINRINTRPSDETGSYDITLVIYYDKEELDEFKASLTKPEETGVSTGTGTDTYAPDTDTPDTEPPVTEVPYEEIYGPSGIGSGGIGGGIGNSPSPYSGVPSDTPEQSKTPLGSVTSFVSGAVYLRLRSFGSYTGTGWAEPAIFTGSFKEQPLNLTLEALEQNGYYGVNDIMIEYKVNDGLVPVPYYTRAGNSGRYVMTDVAVPRADNESNSFFYSQIPTVNVNIIASLTGPAAKENEYRQFVYDNYLDLPEYTKEEILKIINKAGLDPSSPTIISDVADYVRHAAEYSGAFEQIPDGEDRVIYFLTKSKQGICGHFASAATVIYRALGIPARYTVGYYVVVDGNLQSKDFYTKDAHAWVEIYVDNVGWVPVDATGSSVSENGRDSQLQPPDSSQEMFYNKLYFKMKNVSRDYNGEELYSDEAQITAGGNLKEGHRIIARSWGLTNAGTAWCYAGVIKVVDEYGNDVTSLYEIKEVSYAVVTVNTLTVDMPDITLYVGQTIQVPEYAEIVDKKVAELAGSDNVKFDFTSDPAMTVTEEGITGIAATNNRTYVNDVDLGMADSPLIVSDGGAEIVFRQNVTVLPFENVRIKDGEPEKVTDTRITGENGKIYNYLAIRSEDAAKRFDGLYLSCDKYDIIGGALAEGHTISYASASALLYAGEAKNMFSELCVKDENGYDVTSEYIIDFYPGILRVLSGEYNTKDPVVTVSVDGEYELSQIEWTYNVKNVPVSYDVTGKGNNVRVQNGSLIGIEAGKTYIRSYLSGADLNGDGISEYLPTVKNLEVNVVPKEKTGGAVIYIILILMVAAAASAVTYMIVSSVKKNAKEARK